MPFSYRIPDTRYQIQSKFLDPESSQSYPASTFSPRKTMSSLQDFDSYIKDHSLLTHYFYEQKWNNGELTLEELQVYAKEYYQLAKAVPGVVSRVRDRAVERQHFDSAQCKPEFIEMIDENIQEETEHIELWERFSKSLGVSKEELESYDASTEVKEAVAELEALAEESFESGVAAMYAMELEIPAIAESKKDGLCKYYGLNESNEDAHCYFDEHLNEEEHFKVWRKVQMDPAVAEKAVKRSLAAQHKVLDGVCEAAGICMECEQ